jgi:hypothetical protein
VLIAVAILLSEHTVFFCKGALTMGEDVRKLVSGKRDV